MHQKIKFSTLLAFVCLFAYFKLLDGQSYPIQAFAFSVFLILVVATKMQIWLAYYLAALFAASDAIAFGTNDHQTSLHTVGIGLNFFPLMTVIAALKAYIGLTYKGVKNKSNFDYYRLLRAPMFLFFLMFVSGVFFGFHDIRIALSDLFTQLNYIFGITIIYGALRRGLIKHVLYQIIVYLSLICFMGIIGYFLGFGEIAEHIIKPVTDSMRNVIPLLFFFSILGLTTGNTRWFQLVFFGTLLLLSSANIMFYASRGNFVLIVIGLLLLIVAISSKKTKLKAIPITGKVFIVVIITLVILYWYIDNFNPLYFDYLLWKFTSAFEVVDGDRITSSSIRYFSLLNIVSEHLNNFTIFFGVGAGGYFTDKEFEFTSLIVGDGAFNDDWLSKGTLYKPHGTLLFVFLKAGLSGLLAWTALHLVVLKRAIKNIKFSTNRLVLLYNGALICFLPLLYYKAFSTKLQVASAIFLSLTYFSSTYLRRAEV